MTRLFEAFSPDVDFVNGYKIGAPIPSTGRSSARRITRS
jgi:hypothetical protein